MDKASLIPPIIIITYANALFKLYNPDNKTKISENTLRQDAFGRRKDGFRHAIQMTFYCGFIGSNIDNFIDGFTGSIIESFITGKLKKMFAKKT